MAEGIGIEPIISESKSDVINHLTNPQQNKQDAFLLFKLKV